MRRFLLALAVLACAVAPTRAAERITDFLSDITVNADSTVTVAETITVWVEGNAIKRGIFRDFPTRYHTLAGAAMEVEFHVSDVRRDGQAENFALEDLSNGVRIRIGRADVMLTGGSHTYTITYTASRELGFFDGYDEIYWNVTGSAWPFAIDRATAVVHLPAGASVLQHAAYTGVDGAKGRDFAVTRSSGAVWEASTTAALAPGEGFTVAVGFTKGLVTPPPPPPPEIDTSRESLLSLAGGLGFMFLYYLLAWFRVGRDPRGGAIIPQFDAPPELGAAGVRYVWTHSFDEKAFAAGVIGLAAKGRLKITQGDDSTYTLEKLKNDGPALSPGEQALLRAQGGGALKVSDKNHTVISAMRAKLEASLETDFGASTYRANRGWFRAGVPLSLAALVPAFYYMKAQDLATGLLIGVVFAMLWMLLAWLLYLDVRAFFKPGLVRKLLTGIGFVILTVLVLMITSLIVAMAVDKDNPLIGAYAGGFATLVALHVLFRRWMTAATVLGRRLLDQIEGLRLYMTTAEEKRLNMLNPPEKTPQLFERLLPFALALDCENQWSEKFAAVLAAASYAGPSWYVGPGFNINNFSNFSNDLNSSRFDHTASTGTSSSSWSPGSFSGSSGGGSSGGGGGGGGGGGW